jgi:restriction endonuclease S subunit
VNDLAEKTQPLPTNWALVGLGDICKTTSGGTPSRRNPDYYDGDIPWVKSGELPDGQVVKIEEFISEKAVSDSSAKVFPDGTLLVAMYGATVGKLGILKCDAATNQAVCAIFPPKEVETKFLFWFLRSAREELISQAVGGAQPNISQGILREIKVPLAPLNEQTRIVAEIEKQFSRLDEAVANLKRVKANLKRYKAAVLKAAVEGKLTKAIYRRELPGACFTNTLIRFRAVEGVSVEFALIVSRHNMRAGRFVDEGTITTNIAHLSLGRLATVEFPLPPYPEQLRIVAEVERCLTIVANAEAQVDANLRRADRLRQSILKQAFFGQLVPQDPNDEPASVLLERLRANASVGADRWVVQYPTTKGGRIQDSPLRKPRQPVDTKPATPDAFICLDDVTAAILGRMQPGREYARAELADALGLSTGRWNAAIQDLKRQRKVRQLGEKRGARYELVKTDGGGGV